MCIYERERGRNIAAEPRDTAPLKSLIDLLQRASTLYNFDLKRNMIPAQKHQIIHFDCMNRLHTCEPRNFYGFSAQHFYHAAAFECVFSIASSPARSRCKRNDWRWKELTRRWTLPPHSCRTSVVWLIDWLAGQQTDCGQIWTGVLGGGRPERTCHVSSADMENTQEERGTKSGWLVGNRQKMWCR